MVKEDIIYGRQNELKLDIPKTAVVAGIGGVGYWCALELILLGVEHIYLYDRDTLAIHNLNRMPFGVEDIGKPKVELMKELGHRLRPETYIYAQQEWCSADALDGLFIQVDLLIDCTDKFASQKELSAWAREHKTKYVRVGVTTNHITVTSTVAGWGTPEAKEDEQCGVTIPAWVAPCSLAASYGIIKAVLNKNLEVSKDVSE